MLHRANIAGHLLESLLVGARYCFSKPLTDQEGYQVEISTRNLSKNYFRHLEKLTLLNVLMAQIIEVSFKTTFAFIEFEEPESAVAAIRALHQKPFMGKRMSSFD